MRSKKGKITPMQLYSSNLIRYIKKGLADTPVSLGDSEVQVGYEILYSRRSQRVYYYVKALPEYISGSFYYTVREAIALLMTEHPVFTHFRVQGTPHAINWESSEMKERRRQWAAYEKSKKTVDTRFADAETRNNAVFDDWRLKSWDYIQNAEDRKVQLIDCEMTVELSVDGNTDSHKRSLLDACREFEQWCAKSGVMIHKVRNNIMDFLQYTSMTSLNTQTSSARRVSNRVLSSEILGDMISYVPGRINDVGVFFGIDILTGMAVFKNMVRPGGEAENFLVIAETGGGKSFYMKALTIHMALNGFHQVVLDVDGEYRPVAEYLEGVIIDMSKAAGLYFDSTVISDLTGDEAFDHSLLEESRIATCNVFSTLCDIENGLTPTELKLFNDAYTHMFYKYGVNPKDKSTWANSKNLSFHILYNEIKALQDDQAYADYTLELRAFVDKLFIYFDPTGIRSYMFQKPIQLSEILAKQGKLPMFLDIVLNLGPASEKTDVEALIKQATATYLVSVVTNYFKSRHEFSVHYIEEYQRYANSPGVENLVVTMITGNRKRNAATFVISNSPSDLLETGSKANRAVVDNITNYIIGRVKPTAIEMVCKKFSLENCMSDLMDISTEESHKRTFILKINGLDTTIVKQSLPQEIADGPIFKTRDKEKVDKS